MPQLVGCSTTRSKTCLPCRWTARPEGHQAICPDGTQPAAETADGKTGKSRHCRCTDSPDDCRDSKRGEIFVHQSHGTVQKAKVEDRPGVTRTKQWVKIGDQMELLDMPGVLWPKFDDQEVAKRLALPVRLKMILWTWKVWQCSCWNFWRSDTRKHWKLVIKCRFPMRTAGYSCWNSSAENGDADFWRRSQL